MKYSGTSFYNFLFNNCALFNDKSEILSDSGCVRTGDLSSSYEASDSMTSSFITKELLILIAYGEPKNTADVYIVKICYSKTHIAMNLS